jgi:two-component system, sporulation sensor kinase E
MPAAARPEALDARLYLDLRASGEKFRGIVENAPDLIYLIDAHGRITYANPALHRLLGYEARDVYERELTLLRLIHPDDCDRIAALLPDMLAGRVPRAVELRLLHADGTSVRRFSQTNVPLRDDAAGVTGMQCIAHDITDRSELQDEILRTLRFADLGRMAANIAHEIRNPLGAIVNSIAALRQASPTGDRRLLDIVTEEADRLNSILTDVLRFARPAPRMAHACDVIELIDATVELFSRDGKAHGGHAVRVHCPHALPLVLVDANQMRQVLWNLLANAVDAAGGHGAVDVEVVDRREPPAVIISVTDDGPGVADRARVFEPFYTTKTQGTGLGLAIVAQIVRDHGGGVDVRNVAGRGACFTVSLPVAGAGTGTG